MKIELESIEAVGFRSIIRALRFILNRPGLNLVKGANGVGKTTLFEAIVWCLFGINLKDTKMEAVATWEELRPLDWKGTRVMVDLKVNGDHYCIIRHLSYKGKTYGVTGGDSLMIWKGNDEHGEESFNLQGINKDETQEIINKLIGIDQKTFMNSIMFGQRMARLITQDNKDKRALFEQLFDVEWVNVAKKKTEIELTTKMQDLNKSMYDADALSGKIMMAEEAVKRDERLLQEYGQNMANRILDCEANIVGFTTLIKNYDREIVQLSGPPVAYNKEEHDRVEKECNEFINIEHKWEAEIVKFNNTADQIQSKINNNERTTHQLRSRIIRLKEEIKESKNVVKEALDRGVCPACHQSIQKSHNAEIKKMYSTESKEKEITECNTQMVAIDAEVIQLMMSFEIQLGHIKRVKELAAADHERSRLVVLRYQELNKIENNLASIAEKQREIENKMISTKTHLENEVNRLKELKSEKPPAFDIQRQLDAIQIKVNELDNIRNEITRLREETDILNWWSMKGFGAGGIKAFIFNAMLAQLNELTRKYGERLGVSLEFTIDLTKPSKPFTTICSLGTKLNKDYKDFSGGEKQRLDIVLIFAMYDLISINSDINLLIMDEVFEGLDEDGENAVFDLIRLKADEGRSVYVISHSATLDSLYANTIQLGNNLTTEILN